MKKIGVAILGLGVVGGGTYKILTEHRDFYKNTKGIDIVIENVLELDKNRALALGIEESKICTDIAEICSNPEVDIVVEVIGGIEPAKSYVLAALNSGKSVVTSNKELYCKYGHELEKAAKKNRAGLYFEATCVGGVPIIRSMLDNLQGNVYSSVIGIINGTTNYILTKMTESGTDYSSALEEAKKLGYAEADPTSDVEGFDAVYKLSILSSIAFNTKIPYTEIYREGISAIDGADIAFGKQLGYTLKLLAIGKNGKKGIEVRVHPTLIKSTHPLASVKDCFNAVYLNGDSVGDVMLYGRGAGAYPTGSAIVGDIIFCATHSNHVYSTFVNTETAATDTKFVKNFESEYYIRLSVDDKAGVLSKVTAILSKCSISVAQFIQDGEREGDKASLVVITHVTKENSVKKAVAEINATGIANVESVIRVIS
ncbi:MAG: homoserine dehydrogenase [Clostridia bacterium]|nr:homoserine dehydrogenase [Clostridia bacterium]